MKKILKFAVVFTLVFSITTAFGQNAMIKGNEEFKKENYYLALEQYIKAEKRSKSTELTYKLANCYWYLNNYNKALEYYKKIGKKIDTKELPNYGRLLIALGQYEKAAECIVDALEADVVDTMLVVNLETCEWAMRNPSLAKEYKAKRIGLEIDGPLLGVQYFKGGLVYSASSSNKRDERGNKLSDVVLSTYNHGSVDKKSQIFDDIFVSPYQEGSFTFTDNYKMAYFARVEKTSKDGKFIIKIFETLYDGKRWSRPKPFVHNVPDYSCTHPCLAADGSKLFFASDKPNGYGNFDIYVCDRVGNSWNKPLNLGSKVNTFGYEGFPFISDEKTIFFASDGRMGHGGMDIYTVEKVKRRYKIVTNLPKPINSSKNDFAIVVNPNDKTDCVFASNREGDGTKDYLFNAFIDLKKIEENKQQQLAMKENANKSRNTQVTYAKINNNNNNNNNNNTNSNYNVSNNKNTNEVLQPKQNNRDLIYRIQFKSSRKPLDDIEVIEGELIFRYFHKGLYRYTVGEFKDVDDAIRLKNRIINMGYEGSFVVAFDKQDRVLDVVIYK